MIEEQKEKESSEENFFEQMENAPPAVSIKRLQRSRSDVIITGTCSGIAKYFDADVANIRLITTLSLLLGGWSVAAYLITAALLPVEQNPKELTNVERANQRKENFRVVFSGMLILVGFHFAFVQIGFITGSRLFVFPNSFVFPLLSIAMGVYLIISKRKLPEKSEEPMKSFRRTRDNRIILGVCGGIGKYLNVDETTVRIIFIFATLLTLGLFAVGYLAMSLSTQLEEENKVETQ
ncbi:MAG: PspC domain-containing protein [Bacteroidetes bacterium]|nr:PspC domain-containing protein [Bacteroidota bacterium]